MTKDKTLYQAMVDKEGKFAGLVWGRNENEIIERAKTLRGLKMKRFGKLIGNRLNGDMSYHNYKRKGSDRIYGKD